VRETRGSRAAILAAARELFARRGFRGTTIRAIAAAAGVSPSLVVKLTGTKSALYAEVGAGDVPVDAVQLPPAHVGVALVRRIVQRAQEGADEPWSTPSTAIRQAEDPDAERAQIRERWVGWIARLIQDETPEQEHAALVACLLAGLAEGLRTIRVLADPEAVDRLADRYAALVQREIDRMTRISNQPNAW